MTNRGSRLIGLAIFMAVVASACAGGQPASTSTSAPPGTPASAATPNQPVTISFYSGLARPITDALVADFKKRNPQVTVNVFQAPIEQLLQKMQLEIQSSGRIQADVIWTGDLTTMTRLRSQNVLQAYKPEGYDKVPENLRDKDGYWTSSVLLGMYIAYNTKAVPPDKAPSSWKDLQDPMWKDKLVLSDPAVSGTAALLTEALVQLYGWQYWEAIAKNQPKVLPSTVSLVTAVVTGDRPVAPLVDFIAFDSLKKGDPIKVVAPSEGVPFTQIIAAIPAKTDKLATAKTLVDYLVSLEAAKILSDLGYYAARLDADPPKGLPALLSIKQFPVDWATFEKDRADLADRFHSTVGK